MSFQVFRMIFGWFFTAIALFAVSTALPLLAVENGSSTFVGSALGAAAWFGIFLAALTTPVVVSYTSEVYANRIGCLLQIFTLLFLLFIQNYLATFLCAVLIGYGAGLRWVLGDSWVCSLAGENRGKIIGIQEAASGSTLFFGPLLAALLLGEYATLILVSLASTLIAALLVWRVHPAQSPSKLTDGTQTPEHSAGRGWIKTALQHPKIFLSALIGGIFEGGLGTPLALWLTVILGLSGSLAASIVTAVGLGSLSAQIPLGLLSEKYGVYNIQKWCTILLPFGALLIVGSNFSLIIIAFVAFIWGGVGGGLLTLSTIAVGTVNEGSLVSGMSSTVVGYTVGSFLGPLLGQVALQAGAAWNLPALFGLTGTVTWFLLHCKSLPPFPPREYRTKDLMRFFSAIGNKQVTGK